MLPLPEMKQRTLHGCQMLIRRCQCDLCGKACGQECRFSPVFSSTALAEALSHLYSGLWEAHFQLQSSTRDLYLVQIENPLCLWVRCGWWHETGRQEPRQAPFGPLPWAEFLFLQLSQVFCPTLIPSSEGRAGVLLLGQWPLTLWALSLPKVRIKHSQHFYTER